MTTKSINTLKNYPVYVQAHKARYNYVDEIFTSDVSKTFDITLQPFEGLDYNTTENDGSLSVVTADKMLWNKQNYTGSTHVLAPAGSNYLVQSGETSTLQQGCLEAGLTDVTSAKTYTAFVKPEGDLLLSESDADKEGYLWANTITIPAHTTVSNLYKAGFTIAGSDVVIRDTTASGFSTTSWIISDKALPNRTYFPQDLRFITRISTPSISTTQEFIFDDSDNNHGVAIFSDGRLRLWKGSAVYSSVTVKANTFYWMQYIEGSDNISRLYMMEDDGTYKTIEELPDISNSSWTLAIQDVNVLDNTGVRIRFGNGWVTLSEYFRGSIDLLNTRIDVGSTSGWTTYWRALS